MTHRSKTTEEEAEIRTAETLLTKTKRDTSPFPYTFALPFS